MSITETDYSANEFYDGRGIATLQDEAGNVLGQSAATDTTDEGSVSITLQSVGTTENFGQYTIRTFHGLLMSMRDYTTNRYIDYWNYYYNTGFSIDGSPTYTFPGLGPYILRSISAIGLGYTSAGLWVGLSVSVLSKAALYNTYTKVANCNVRCPVDQYIASYNMGQHIAAGVPWVAPGNTIYCANISAVHSTSSATSCQDFWYWQQIWW